MVCGIIPAPITLSTQKLMSKHTLLAEELAKEILKTLEGSGLLKAGSDTDGTVVDTLSRLMVSAGFPEKDVLTKNITILLSDIRGFSEIAESYPARDVVSLLNRYFDCMGTIITRYGGTIDKLMGDSILVIFGIPNAKVDDAENAIACSVEMQLAMNALNKSNQALGMPDLYMGIALNTGIVVAGELGSIHYKEYTVIGDEVNLTSRIESHCLRGQILISENTYKEVKDFIEVGEPNTIEVKGIRKAVKLYELHATTRPRPLEVPRREGRNSPRISVRMPVNFQTLSGKIVLDEKHQGEVLDISYNGLLIETAGQLGKSSEIKMSLAFELFSNKTTDVYARIIRTEKIDDMFRSSLEFTTIGTKGLKAIKQYVDQLVASS